MNKMRDAPTGEGSISGGNHLLARLPEDVLERLRPHLKRVNLARDEVLYEARGRIDAVYFPTGSVLSALTIMRNGRAIEVGTIGREGAAGISAVVGTADSPHRMIAQISDGALRIPVGALRAEVTREGPLWRLLHGYQAFFVATVSQSVACNGLHPIEERCCRWLLMTHDRVENDVIRLTHEYLAFMLGVRRAGVTEVLQSLRERELIGYTRGQITMLDRPGMEAACCECYAVVNEEYGRLLR